MQRIVEKGIRGITGQGRLYQVVLNHGNGCLSYIETDKENFEVSDWDAYCSCCCDGCFMDVSNVEGSSIVDAIRGIFGSDAKIIAYADAWSSESCHKDDFIFKTSSPDIFGSVSVQPDNGVNYIVCVPPKRKLDFSDVEGEMIYDGTAIVFPEQYQKR